MLPARFPASWILKMRSAFLRCWYKLNEFWEDGEFWGDHDHGRHERAIAARVMTWMWSFKSFLGLIMLSSLIAHLLGFLPVEKLLMAFDDGGSTKGFFQKSTMVTYKRMEKCADEEYVNSNHEGIEKVKQDDYAYFMETTSIENDTERECNITMIGGKHNLKASGGISKLQKQGQLNTFKKRWGKPKKCCDCCCDETSKSSELQPDVLMKNFRAVTLLMLVLIMMSAVVGIMESIYILRKLHRRNERFRANN
ncbi:glutamate receptor ionotropic, kainate 2 [Caerostris darwini]|uniref:Glutamate receptor ionotropic, kainate 2 n=1 Tax=Caerostris darwini TaxID=1538125 RepID=A0AAV4UE39_9ARAC|nr:glutamate receptor ionotropic, kainate 2 [Caerostris darwini]